MERESWDRSETVLLLLLLLTLPVRNSLLFSSSWSLLPVEPGQKKESWVIMHVQTFLDRVSLSPALLYASSADLTREEEKSGDGDGDGDGVAAAEVSAEVNTAGLGDMDRPRS